MYSLIISGTLLVISITVLILNNALWHNKDEIRKPFSFTLIFALAITLFCSVFAPFMTRDRYTVKREELVYKLEHMSIDQELYREYKNFNDCVDIINTHWLSFETEDCSDLYINIRDYLGD